MGEMAQHRVLRGKYPPYHAGAARARYTTVRLPQDKGRRANCKGYSYACLENHTPRDPDKSRPKHLQVVEASIFDLLITSCFTGFGTIVSPSNGYI
jgi:hypothetical protein